MTVGSVRDVASPIAHRRIVGLCVDACDYASASERILGWARAGESRAVVVATVHSVMEARDDPSFGRLLEGADLTTPDGMPLVWGLRALGARNATRVYGPDLTRALCARAAAEGIPVGFYGGTPAVLAHLVATVERTYPGLRVAYAWSPPFRALTGEETAQARAAIAASGARILFAGIGCPKQERWILEQRGHVPAVMIGVGAAFDFIAGAKRQAPRPMQAAGLEWLFRLCSEPRRLWRRYCKHNPRFVLAFARQLAHGRGPRGGRA